MNRRSLFVGILVILGTSLLGVSVYSFFNPSRPSELPLSKETSSDIVKIPMSEYTNSQWSNRGATVDYKNTGRPYYVWMADTGSIRYSFDLTKNPTKDGNVFVLMSSELFCPEEQINDPTLTSDVTIEVNGKEPNGSTQNVIKDTGANSQRYNWHVPASFFKQGQNSIEFQVRKDAKHQHGITIWSEITVEFR